MSLLKGLYGEKKETIRLQADATSLADLKAETVRKKTEALQNRQKGNFRPEKNVDKKKTTNIWSKENSGLLARMQRDMEKNEEEERTWSKSKSIMERKSKIYDSLKKGKGRSEIAENFLVKFDNRDSSSDSDEERYRERRDYPAADEGEEWVEYTDALGRTRTCMKKELKRLKDKDKDIVRSDSDDEDKKVVRETGQNFRIDDAPDLLSEDMRRDILRQKWEQEEMENLTKDSLHYTDVRYDEARAHGAGFYAFSKDEQKRQTEQSTLKKLHEETDEARRQREKKEAKRKKEMAERIRKIKQKRREKMGLPPLEEDEPKKDGGDDDSNSEPETDITKSVMEGLKMFRKANEEEERRRNEIRRMENLRDWDLDKEELGEMKKEWKVLTQQEWLDKQRKERNNEFAPPSAYNEARVLLQKKEEAFIEAHQKKSKKKKKKNKGGNNQTSRGPSSSDGPPPKKFSKIEEEPEDVSLPSDFNPHLPPPSMAPVMASTSSATMKPFDPMALLDVKPDSAPENRQKPSMSSYSTAVRVDLHRRMQEHQDLPQTQPGLNTRIINELEEFDESDDEDEEEEAAGRRGQRAEVAPPCDMTYYNSGGTGGQRVGASGFRSHEDMASAFNAGLQSMKKK